MIIYKLDKGTVYGRPRYFTTLEKAKQAATEVLEDWKRTQDQTDPQDLVSPYHLVHRLEWSVKEDPAGKPAWSWKKLAAWIDKDIQDSFANWAFTIDEIEVEE